MPWNLKFAQILAIAQDASLINVVEYELIRNVLQSRGTALNMEQVAITESPPAKAASPAKFIFGKSSEKELVGVDSDLVACTRLALTLTTQDFVVFDGIRSLEEQKAHVANGTSTTMESLHLKGKAVDLVPWVGKPVWDWDRIYDIALAMDTAATKLNLASRIRWGGAWDRRLSDFGGDRNKYLAECQAYQKRHPGKDFIDGPHFEIHDK